MRFDLSRSIVRPSATTTSRPCLTRCAGLDNEADNYPPYNIGVLPRRVPHHHGGCGFGRKTSRSK